MVESDAGAGESVLGGGRNAGGVAIGGDGNGPTIIHFDEGGAYVLGNRVGVAASGHLAVLYVPPNGRLGGGILRLHSAAASDGLSISHHHSLNPAIASTPPYSKFFLY